MQGDAVERPDRFPVHYSQIKAIYRGQHVPFVGSFVFFMQSPAGWLCFLLIVFGMIWASVLERKLIDEKEVRLVKMQLLAPDQTAAAIRERKQAERANKRRQRAEARQAKRAEQKQRRDKAKQEQKEEPKQQEETSEKGDGRS
ncbi:MAG: hypothetical protein IJY42_04060 [Clostridia bacterium]|nr:hypothetical protein [Clostridia bacterium]